MIEVKVDPCAKGFAISWVRSVIDGTLASEGKHGYAVSVLLTGDKEIRKINRKYLGHDYATDVIAFGLGEGPMLGDVVVSVETARSTARELGIPFKEELARYLVHGTLHLLGYEDKPKKKHDKMHARQEKLLSVILAQARIKD